MIVLRPLAVTHITREEFNKLQMNVFKDKENQQDSVCVNGDRFRLSDLLNTFLLDFVDLFAHSIILHYLGSVKLYLYM